MRIGLDFDNTIVSYDALFHRVACERGLVPSGIPVNKVAVRDYLRGIGQEDRWTEMQGYVYGARMDEAAAYPGALEAMQAAIDAGHELAIISHKTMYPFMGPKYDLHAAARGWVESHLSQRGCRLISEDRVFFELTKDAKLSRIGQLSCDLYLDDLPEILQAEAFPRSTRRILFDPDDNHAGASLPGISVLRSWDQFGESVRA